MKAYLTRRYMFSASHRLHADALSEEQNRVDLWQVQSIRTDMAITMRSK